MGIEEPRGALGMPGVPAGFVRITPHFTFELDEEGGLRG